MSYNTNRSERGATAAGFIAPYMIGLAVGSVIFGFGQYSHGKEVGYQQGQDDNRTVQLENQELQATLHRDFSPVNQLVLDTKDNTFSFQTTDEQTSQPEICTGTYKVGNHIVTVVGTLSCTHTVETNR